jgi:predicted HTH transcriptional regulator
MLTPQDVLRVIKQGEGQVLEFKASAILGDNFEFAKDMGAMTNAEGGQILIGVLDDETIEGMKAKEGHEEHIMLMSTSRCTPPLRVSFENIRIPRKGDVYVITIQRRGIVFHGVRTEGGILAYFIRRGKIVTQLTPEEMFVEQLKEKYAGVEVQHPETPISRFLMAQGRRILQKVFKRLDVRQDFKESC